MVFPLPLSGYCVAYQEALSIEDWKPSVLPSTRRRNGLNQSGRDGRRAAPGGGGSGSGGGGGGGGGSRGGASSTTGSSSLGTTLSSPETSPATGLRGGGIPSTS